MKSSTPGLRTRSKRICGQASASTLGISRGLDHTLRRPSSVTHTSRWVCSSEYSKLALPHRQVLSLTSMRRTWSLAPKGQDPAQHEWCPFLAGPLKTHTNASPTCHRCDCQPARNDSPFWLLHTFMPVPCKRILKETMKPRILGIWVIH